MTSLEGSHCRNPISGPYAGLTVGGGVINWLGGGDARHRHSVDLEGSGGMLFQNFF